MFDNPSDSSLIISLKTSNVDLVVALEEMSVDHLSERIHPLGTRNVRTKLHCNQPNMLRYFRID